MRRNGGTWVDGRGEQYDTDLYTYSFVPNPTTPTSGVSGTLAPGVSAVCPVNIEADSWFQWEYSTLTANNAANDATGGLNNATAAVPNLNIQITDTAAGRNLFNEPLPAGLVAGSAALPHVLPFPRRFKPTTTILLNMTNFDTAISMNRIQFNMIGRKIYRAQGQREPQRFNSWRDEETGRLLAEDYFVYHFGFGALVPGASLVTSQIIEADADFEARLATGQSIFQIGAGAASALSTVNYLTFSLKDGGTQRVLSNTNVNGGSFAGGSGLPLIYPVPRVFLRKTTVQITETNISAGVTTAQADIALSGRKIFEFNE